MNEGLERILREVFEAQGAVDAAGLASRAVKDFEDRERDARICEMRRTLTVRQIAEREGLTERRVLQIQKEQLELRRSRTK